MEAAAGTPPAPDAARTPALMKVAAQGSTPYWSPSTHVPETGGGGDSGQGGGSEGGGGLALDAQEFVPGGGGSGGGAGADVFAPAFVPGGAGGGETKSAGSVSAPEFVPGGQPNQGELNTSSSTGEASRPYLYSPATRRRYSRQTLLIWC